MRQMVFPQIYLISRGVCFIIANKAKWNSVLFIRILLVFIELQHVLYLMTYPAPLTEGWYGFPHFLQGNAGMQS